MTTTTTTPTPPQTPKTIEINRLQAISLLKRVVEGNEDKVYAIPADKDFCQYHDGDAPSCLIGNALAEAGVPVSFLAWLDTLDDAIYGVDDGGHEVAYGGTGIGDLAGTPALNNDVVILTDGAISVFMAAQRSNDNFETWGDCLDQAIRRSKGE